MIPEKLTIEGVYSYKNRQTIDFSTLSEAGIFGVFGNVGSGKSAILEAMTYALYGQIERLNDKEQRGYNIMNLQSSALYIDFIFSQDRENYRFTVTAKRNRKDFSKIQSPERAGYKKEGSQWIPLPDEGIRGGITAESIIGLNYEHFRKTVIIPQGKFQEFIQLPPSQRTGMIETLFGLQRFNLSADCNFLLARNREECSFLEGRLNDLQELKTEDLIILEQKARKRDEELQSREQKKKKLATRLTALLEYIKTKTAFEENHHSLEQLELKSPEISEQESLLKKSRLLQELFKPLLLRENELNNDLEKQKEESRRLLRESGIIEERLKEGNEYWQNLKKDQEEYSLLRKTLDSLIAVAELKELNRNKEKNEVQASIVSKELSSGRTSLREMNTKRAELDSSVKELEQKVEQGEKLSAVEDWYRQQEQLKLKHNELFSRIEDYRMKEQKAFEELTEIIPEEKLLENRAVSMLEENILEDLRKNLEQLKEKEEIQKLKAEDSTRLRLLSDMAHELTEGKPCPLCGSEHHPQVHEKYNESGISEELEILNRERQTLSKQKEDILGILPRLKYLEQERSESETLLVKVKADEKSHLETFHWSFVKADDKELFNRLKAELIQNKTILKDLRQKQSLLEDEKNKLENQTREKEGELIRLETGTEHLNTQKIKLEDLILDQHKNKSPETNESESLKRRLDNLDRDYQRIKTSRENEEKKLQELNNKNESSKHIIQKTSDDLKHIRSLIENKRAEQNIPDREQLDSLLKESEDLEAIQEEIDSFHRDRNILLEKQKTLSESVSKLEKDPVLEGELEADPQLLQQDLTILDEELQNLLTGAGALGKQIDDLRSKLEQKETLSKELKKQSIRNENLKELSSLFKGGKFVQYIAAVYMQEMCQLANRRFSPLSGRSLELVFQENQIMVRDFLNEGRLRHIKTLSGGQSFQAALCLALALAEQTGRGKGSFFFLDEGFGSLDKASLETVMITLRELSREGRIIGLISHVEEMQQDLDVWIRIKRDSQEGSSIQSSWKPSALKGEEQ